MGTPNRPTAVKGDFKYFSEPASGNSPSTDLSASGGTDGLMFQFDDVHSNDEKGSSTDEKSKEEEDTRACMQSHQQMASPNDCHSHPSGEVFLSGSSSFPKMRATPLNKSQRPKSLFQAQLSAIDTILPIGLQRHTNFTPPRLSPQLHEGFKDDLSSFLCSVHKRRSSACLLVHKCDVEKEIGLGLRSISDHFNVEIVGLSHGYHVQGHPHSCYHKPYSSSYPGAPSLPVAQRDSIQGVKIRKGSVPFKSPCDVQ